MKIISLISLLIFAGLLAIANAQETSEDFFIDVNQFFNKNVVDGRINYNKLKNNPAELNQLVNNISNIDYKVFKSGNEEKAFLINVYNIPIHNTLGKDSFNERALCEVSSGMKITEKFLSFFMYLINAINNI